MNPIIDFRRPIGILSIALGFFAHEALAQKENAPSTDYTPKIPRESRNVSNSATASLIALSPASRESTPLQLGPVLFRPAITYSYTDATNLLRSVGDPQDSIFEEISLNLAFDYTELWTFIYRPSWTYYSNDRFEDSTAHSADFSTNFAVQDWGIGFRQSYRDSNGSLVQTGSQTQQEIWGTTLSASRQINSSWYLDLSANQDLRAANNQDLLAARNYPDVKDRSISGWLRHQATSALNSSIGLVWGYADIDPGLNTKYMQALLRFGFRPTDKLSVSLQGGIDSRQIDAPGFDRQQNPTYNGSIQYQAFDHTTLAFSMARQISASYFSNFNNEMESVTLSLRQRLLEHFNLTVSYGEQSSKFLDFFGNFAVARSDEYNSFSINLSTQLMKRISLSAFYRNNENASNVTGFGFSSDQTGFQIGYRY